MRFGLPLVFLSGCFVSLNLPNNEQIGCASNSDCPSGWSCNPNSAKCISRSSTDFSVPSAANAAVTPAVGKAGTVFTVTFDVNKHLDLDPKVDFIDGTTRITMTASGSDLHYTASYTASGSESEGAHQLEVTLQDAQGNTATVPLGVQLSFDFTPPAVLEASAPLFTPNAFSNNPPNPLRTPAALMLGTGFSISFTVSEALSAATLVTVANGAIAASGLVFDLPLEGGIGLVASLAAPSTPEVDGTYDLAVTLTDLAGNQAVVTLMQGLIVDNTPPAAPNVDSAIAFVRQPNGDATTDAASFGMTGNSGAVEANALVVVSSDALAAFELARVNADAAGAFSAASLPILDRASVYVSAVDQAGNRSPIVATTQSLLVAALGGKVLGDNANPQQFEERPRFESTVLPDAPAFLDAASGVATSSDSVVVTTASTGRWYDITPTGTVFNSGGSIVYDRLRRRYWGYGGTSVSPEGSFDESGLSGARLGGDWQFPIVLDPERDGNPGGAKGNTLFVDSDSGDLVLAIDDGQHTWVWNQTSWRRVAPLPGEPALPTNTQIGVAFDPGRHIGVLYGNGQTWLWQGEHWHQQCASACGPTPNGAPALVYDTVARHVVLFDGALLWAFDGTTWSPVTTVATSPAPAPRAAVQMAFDEARGKLVIYGGCNTGNLSYACSNAFFDTWEWDGSSWSCNRPTEPCDPVANSADCPASGELPICNASYIAWSGTGPHLGVSGYVWPTAPPLTGTGGVLVYDNALGKTVLLGGQAAPYGIGIPPQTQWSWVWDGANWSPINAGTFNPLPTQLTWVADPPDNLLLGLGDTSLTPSQYWTYDGYGLAIATLASGTVPVVDSNSVAAYDPGTGEVVVLLDNSGTQTWTFQSSRNPQWLQCTTGCVSEPTFLAGSVFTADPDLGGLVYIGAPDASDNNIEETWLWSADAWTRLSPAMSVGPTEPFGLEAAYSPRDGKLWATGGNFSFTPSRNTWSWTNSGPWAAESDAPLFSSQGMMVSDSWTGRAILLGGINGCSSTQTSLDCTTLLSPDSGWQGVATATLASDVFPGARTLAGVAFHAATGGLLLTGGFYILGTPGDAPEPKFLTDAWVWRSEATEPSAHVFWIGIDAAVEPSAHVPSLSVDWIAGCDANGKSGAVGGCRLLVWNGVVWAATTVTHSAPSAAPALLHWDSATDLLWASAPDLRTMTVGGDLLVALLPASLSPSEQQNMGPQPYTVATDAVSATLRISE